MGIRLNTNTWRAPLQLIDCWLPLQASHTPTQRAIPLFLQRFARAGWLKPAGKSGAPTDPRPASAGRLVTHISPHPRCLRVHSTSDSKCSTQVQGGRFALSGRISDVCAELDRLAALEHPSGHKQAIAY